VVERCVGGKNHRRNVDPAFKKSNLRTTTKMATNVGKMAVNKNGAAEKPKHWSCNFGWDKSYKTTDKTSSKVRRTRETSIQKATKATKNIKEKREERREEMRSFPPPSSSWIKKKKTMGEKGGENRAFYDHGLKWLRNPIKFKWTLSLSLSLSPQPSS